MSSEFSVLRQQTGLKFEQLESLLGISARTLRRYETGAVIPKPPVIEFMRRLVEQCHISARTGISDGRGRTFRFIDLFAGIGGLRKGFESIGGKCVFTSEWNERAQITYRANFADDDDHQFAGDITQVESSSIPEHDVLLAGFPCQPFRLPESARRIHWAANMAFYVRPRELCSSMLQDHSASSAACFPAGECEKPCES